MTTYILRQTFLPCSSASTTITPRLYVIWLVCRIICVIEVVLLRVPTNVGDTMMELKWS